MIRKIYIDFCDFIHISCDSVLHSFSKVLARQENIFIVDYRESNIRHFHSTLSQIKPNLINRQALFMVRFSITLVLLLHTFSELLSDESAFSLGNSTSLCIESGYRTDGNLEIVVCTEFPMIRNDSAISYFDSRLKIIQAKKKVDL